jgi:antitoxin HigA-1
MKPSHPGRILRNMHMEPLGLNLTVAAANLGVTRKTLSLLLNEHQGISAEMALRLGKIVVFKPMKIAKEAGTATKVKRTA